jgi:DNA replication factor GINS
LEEPGADVAKIFEQREREFLLAPVRVTMKTSTEEIEVGDLLLKKANDGERVELPRWVAEELVELGLAEVQEEAFEVEIFKALTREKILASPQLSPLEPNFYIRMRRRLAAVRLGVERGKYRREDYEKLRTTSYDLIGRRLSKLLSMSSSANVQTIADRITPEEKAFFTMSSSISAAWKNALLGEQ